MPNQTINATLSDADMQAVKDAINLILQKLPFLITLTPDERVSTTKAGPDSVSFLTNALTAAQDNAIILPGSFVTKAFQNRVELFTALTELNTLLASLASQVDDTRLAVGGEAMQQATQVYTYVKAAAKTVPGLKPIAEQLGERFRRASKQKKSAKPDA